MDNISGIIGQEIDSTSQIQNTAENMQENFEETGEKPLDVLKRTLSTKSRILTTSGCFQPDLEHKGLRTIGLGSCGTVFEIIESELAFKKGSSASAIWTDFCLTNRVHNAIRDMQTKMQEAFPEAVIPGTPLCYEFHPVDDEGFWSRELERFPITHRTRQPLFMVDQILPLPQEAREALIALYFDEDEEAQRQAKGDSDNNDCLVRVYLGERESTAQQSDVYDSLRNFPLRLNMMEDLDLEVMDLAKEMAIGLAILHWQAQVDGMDVEFVLGGAATKDGSPGFDDLSKSPHSVNSNRYSSRRIHLWMFDLDKASEIELTRHDVTSRLVPAFLGNDPYYPRPGVDHELWAGFCVTYLKASRVIILGKRLEKEFVDLPQWFLDEVLRVSKEHEDWNEEQNIVFAD